MYPRVYLEDQLGIENAEIFARWAIGDDFNDVYYDQWPVRWNSLHGDKLKLSSEGYREIDLAKMIEVWREINA